MLRGYAARGIAPVLALGLLVFATVGASAGVYMVVTNETEALSAHPQVGVDFDKQASQHFELSFISEPTSGDVYVQSPLGTETPLEEVGDERVALAFSNGPTTILIKNEDGTHVATRRTIDYGISPDAVVAKDGSGDYTSIQSAVEGEPANSTIAVKRDIYHTSASISTPMTLVAETGTILQPADDGPALTINTRDVILQNFRIEGDGSSTGIRVNEPETEIVGNMVFNASTGVDVQAKCVAVEGNIVADNERGIVVRGTDGRTLVSQNDLSHNSESTIDNVGGQNIDALNNYWGVDDPNSTVSGSVNIVNPLNNFEGPFVVGKGDAIERIEGTDGCDVIEMPDEDGGTTTTTTTTEGTSTTTTEGTSTTTTEDTSTTTTEDTSTTTLDECYYNDDNRGHGNSCGNDANNPGNGGGRDSAPGRGHGHGNGHGNGNGNGHGNSNGNGHSR